MCSLDKSSRGFLTAVVPSVVNLELLKPRFEEPRENIDVLQPFPEHNHHLQDGKIR